MDIKKAFALLAVGVALGLAGQASAADPPKEGAPKVDPSITDGSAVREFKQARARWLRAGIASYRMKVSRYCFCASPFKSTVTVLRTKPKKSSAKGWTGPRTVPQMFRAVGQAIKHKVAVLDVRYDPKRGFVRKAAIDYIAMAIDDEVTYRTPWLKPYDFAVFD